LPIEFGEFAGAKRLRKRREPLEEVTQLPIHCEPIIDMAEVCKQYGVQRFEQRSWKMYSIGPWKLDESRSEEAPMTL